MVKKLSLKRIFLYTRDFTYFRFSRKQNKTKKKLACKAEKAFIYQPWSETIS